MDSAGTDGGGPSAKKAKLEATNPTVTLNLTLADGTTAAATPKLLEMSTTLAHCVGDSSKESSAGQDTAAVPATAAVLAAVEAFCESGALKNAADLQFETLLQLIKAANFLDIAPMLQATYSHAAAMIKKATSRSIPEALFSDATAVRAPGSPATVEEAAQFLRELASYVLVYPTPLHPPRLSDSMWLLTTTRPCSRPLLTFLPTTSLYPHHLCDVATDHHMSLFSSHSFIPFVPITSLYPPRLSTPTLPLYTYLTSLHVLVLALLYSRCLSVRVFQVRAICPCCCTSRHHPRVGNGCRKAPFGSMEDPQRQISGEIYCRRCSSWNQDGKGLFRQSFSERDRRRRHQHCCRAANIYCQN